MLGACLVLVGCGAPGEIPVGSWAGDGVCMIYQGVLAENQSAPEEQAESRTYRTTLQITKTRAFGRDALRLRINSKSGKLLDIPGEEVVIDGVLTPIRTLDNGATLYAALDSDKRGDSDLPPKTFAQATSTRTDRGVILQLHYTKPGDTGNVVIDTFHFQAAGVIKTGSYIAYRDGNTEKTLARIWWVEELRPARPVADVKAD